MAAVLQTVGRSWYLWPAAVATYVYGTSPAKKEQATPRPIIKEKYDIIPYWLTLLTQPANSLPGVALLCDEMRSAGVQMRAGPAGTRGCEGRSICRSDAAQTWHCWPYDCTGLLGTPLPHPPQHLHTLGWRMCTLPLPQRRRPTAPAHQSRPANSVTCTQCPHKLHHTMAYAHSPLRMVAHDQLLQTSAENRAIKLGCSSGPSFHEQYPA